MSFNSIRSRVLSLIVLLVIVFFLPFQQDFFATAKWYLVGCLALLLLLSSVGEFFLSKKVIWQKRESDTPLILFLIAGFFSVLFGSVNKVQALLNPHFGLLTFVFLFVIYYYISRSHKKLPSRGMVFTLFSILFSLTVVVETVPFITSRLPNVLQQFQNSTLAGTLIDALVFLGLAAMLFLSSLLKKGDKALKNVISFIGFVTTTLTAVILLFILVKNSSSLALPSFSHSWYAAVEVLKRPMTAFFGVGIDNFSSLFVKIKDLAYNSSPLWHISTFSLSRTALFHVMAELGLFGVGSLIFIFSLMVKKAFSPSGSIMAKLVSFYFIMVFLLTPPSFILFFLLFVWIGVEESDNKSTEIVVDFREIIPAYALVILIGMMGLAAAFLMLGRLYFSEYMFQKSFTTNNLKDVYEIMKTALIYNPYNERIHNRFVQVNLTWAYAVANRATKNEKGEPQLSEMDRQTISQAIQASIDEAKAVVSLNPNKASNWELLATVYKSIASIVQGADSWTVSAYQRAVLLDPQNPTFRVALGSVLYAYKQYDDASRLFEQAVSLKPDWPNAQYNYAWTLYQKGDYLKAATAMQTCVSLLNPSKDAADYKKASADFEEFKKKIPAESQVTQTPDVKATQTKETLSLPPIGSPQIDPKISLPKTASPEAK